MSTALAFTLRGYRISAGLSQNALARQASINPGYVNLMEKGHRIPTSAVVHRLAAAMRLDEYETGRLMVAAGHWPWKLAPEDTRLLLEIGGRIAQAAGARQEAAS